MNSFSVYIKENGTYEKINGVAVFPFNFGQLLDEQLDEVHLVIKMSPKEHYEPLTEMKIDIEKRNSDKMLTVIESKYFVIAQDKSREFPMGKGTYTHELYLIERTKLLEGILCQSMTFTNTLGNNGTAYKSSAFNIYDGIGAINTLTDEIKFLYTTPKDNRDKLLNKAK